VITPTRAEDCLKSAGKETSSTVSLNNFTELDVDGKAIIELVYRPNSFPEAEITYNENLIPGIRFEIKDGVLKIREHNTCNWVRKSGLRPHIKLYINDLLTHINIDGIADLYNTDTIRSRNFYIKNSGIGTVDLTVWGMYGMECNGFNSGKFKIKGFLGYIASTLDDACSLDTRGLILDDLYLFNYSLNPSYVGSKVIMQIKNSGYGDVFVHEFPNDTTLSRCCVFEINRQGKGKVIF
jgi:hypothetical protein